MIIKQDSLIDEIESSKTIVQEMPINGFVGLSISTIVFYSDSSCNKNYCDCVGDCFHELIREQSEKEIFRKYYYNISEAINNFMLFSEDGSVERTVFPRRVTLNASFFDCYNLKRSYTVIFNSSEDLKNMYDDLICRAYEFSNFYNDNVENLYDCQQL